MQNHHFNCYHQHIREQGNTYDTNNRVRCPRGCYEEPKAKGSECQYWRLDNLHTLDNGFAYHTRGATVWNAKQFLNGSSIFRGLSYIWFKKLPTCTIVIILGRLNLQLCRKNCFHSEGSYGILKTFIYIFYMSLVRRYLDAEGEEWLT